WQREQVEPDVLAVNRIARAERHMKQVLQQYGPVLLSPRGDEQGEQRRAAGDKLAPRKPLTHECERTRRRLPSRGRGRRRRRWSRKMPCEPPVQPHHDRGCSEQDDKQRGFGGE